MSTDESIAIGELARLTGVTTRTLRHFESMGLLQPGPREQGRIRRFSPESAARLSAILRLKSAGLKLSQIKDMLDSGRVRGTGGQLARSILMQLKARSDEIEHQISRHVKLLDELHESISILEACLGCNAVPEPSRCARCKVVSSREAVPSILSCINPNIPREQREP